jgi:hypothetical protein
MHPLFAHAQLSTARSPEIGFIQARRRDLERQRWSRVLGTFPADMLRTTEPIATRYGGGEYELIGRCARNRRITARVKVVIVGPPIPLSDTEDRDAETRERGSEDAPPDDPGPAHPPEAAPRRRQTSAEKRRQQLELGALHAKAFQLFSKKAPLARVVRETRLPLEEVRRLWTEFVTPLKNPAEMDLERHVDEMRRVADEEARDRRERWRADRERDREAARLKLLDRWLTLRERQVEIERPHMMRAAIARAGEPLAPAQNRFAIKQQADALDAALDRLLAAFLAREDGAVPNA